MFWRIMSDVFFLNLGGTICISVPTPNSEGFLPPVVYTHDTVVKKVPSAVFCQEGARKCGDVCQV